MNSNEDKFQYNDGLSTSPKDQDIEGVRSQGCINAKMIYTLLQTVRVLDEMDLLNVGGFNFSKCDEIFILTKGERVIEIGKQNNKITLVRGSLDYEDSAEVTQALMSVCSQKGSFESRFRTIPIRQNYRVSSGCAKDAVSDTTSEVDEFTR